jgi:glyoxylase I family protein
MKPVALHHVSINVTDVEAARRFYVEELGLVERADRPDFPFDGAWLDVDAGGGQQVHLIAADPPAAKGQHFAVLVDDLDDVVAELRGRGHQVTDPQPVGPSRQAFVTDPSGNLVELHQTSVG